jgi:succinate dehydrogenase / fumarate reductase flavoprotein subunit
VSAEKPTRIIDIAVASELARGREVFLDFARNPDGFEWRMLAREHRERFDREAGGAGTAGMTPLRRLLQINAPIVDWLEERFIRLRAGEMMQIRPKVQHFEGGVKINARAATTVRGLFAAGECAGGQHGANRPGGNALLDTQVFGRIAGESAARFAACRRALDESVAHEAVRAWLSGRARDQVAARDYRHANAGVILGAVQFGLSRAAGVMRTDGDLAAVLRRIAALHRRNPSGSNAAALEAANALTVAEMILRAALLRDESRGPHLRFAGERGLDPLPSRPEWERYIVISRAEDGTMQLEPRRPGALPFDQGESPRAR